MLPGCAFRIGVKWLAVGVGVEEVIEVCVMLWCGLGEGYVFTAADFVQHLADSVGLVLQDLD
jgi:hypothetical protein